MNRIFEEKESQKRGVVKAQTTPGGGNSGITYRQPTRAKDQTGVAVLLATATSFCCGINLISNLILSIVLKKAAHISICLVMIACVIGIIFMGYQKTEEIERSIPAIEFNDTIQIQLSNDQHIKQQINSYFENKYRSLISIENLNSEDQNDINMIFDRMANSVYGHAFDTMIVDDQMVFSKAIYSLMASSNESISSGDEFHIRICKIYVSNYTMQNLISRESKELRDKVCDIKMKDNSNIDSYSIFGWILIVLIWIISLLQSFYLWITFFKRKNEPYLPDSTHSDDQSA